MASSNAIRAGRAFVELFADDTKLVRVLNGAKAKLNAFGASVAGIGAAFVGLGATIAAPLGFAVNAASDAAETFSKFDIVFGKQAEAVKAWANEFAAQVGRSRAEVAKFLAGTQDLFVPLGFDPAKAEELSKKIVGLTVDLGSFNNMADEDVMRDLQAALTGSGEVMKKYGVLVDEAAVKQELLNQKLDPTKVTNQDKVLARLNIIMRGTTAAHGDAIRTAGGFANQMKATSASIQDVAVAIGSILLPVVTPMVSMFREATVSVGEFLSANTALVLGVAGAAAGITAIGGALLVVAGAAKVLAFAIGPIVAGITAVSAVLGFIVTPLGAVTTAVVAGVGAWLVYSETGQAALVALANVFGQLKADAMATIQGIVDALAAGDIVLAGEVAMAGLNVAWTTALNGLETLWIGLKDAVTEVFINLSAALRGIWAELFAELSRAFPGLVKIAAQAGSMIQGFFQDAAGYILQGVGLITDEERRQASDDLAKQRAADLQRTIDDVDRANANPEAFVQEELAKLEAARKAAQEARAAGTAEEIRTAEASLEAARKKLTEATERATAARAAAESGTKPIEVKPPDLTAVENSLAKSAEKMKSLEKVTLEAMVVGSKEAAEHILKSLGAKKDEDLAKQQVAQSKKANALLQNIETGIRNALPLAPSTI
jgi:hypothetical protein